jgi:hypothetical protein
VYFPGFARLRIGQDIALRAGNRIGKILPRLGLASAPGRRKFMVGEGKE